MSNIYNFRNPNKNFQETEEEHRCDSCASRAIHEISYHEFEKVDPELMIESCLDQIFEAIAEDDDEWIVEAVIELFHNSFHEGYMQHKKNMIHRLSGEMIMMTSEVEGEEQ